MHSFRTRLNTRTTDPRGLELQNFWRDILPHHNYVLHLLNIYEQRKRSSMNYWIHSEPLPITRSTEPRAMNFTILEKTFLLIITIYLHVKFICLILRSKGYFQRINVFPLKNHLSHTLAQEPLIQGPINIQFRLSLSSSSSLCTAFLSLIPCTREDNLKIVNGFLLYNH